jgi:hypothetical protein
LMTWYQPPSISSLSGLAMDKKITRQPKGAM